jgi:hypothetical protein
MQFASGPLAASLSEVSRLGVYRPSRTHFGRLQDVVELSASSPSAGDQSTIYRNATCMKRLGSVLATV